MKIDYNKIAQSIQSVVSNKEIINISHCITRLRIKFKDGMDDDLKQKLSNIDGVLGVIKSGDECQIVIGAGHVNHVYDEFIKIRKQTQENPSNSSLKTNEGQAKSFGQDEKILNKKKRQSNLIAGALSKFAKVFAPIIPAFIACGILTAIGNIIQTSCYDYANQVWDFSIAKQWYYFFNLFTFAWQTAFYIFVGYQFVEIFGGKGWIGALVGVIFTPLAGAAFNGMLVGFGTDHMTFLGIPVHDLKVDWMTSGLVHTNQNTGEVDGLGQAVGSIFGIILLGTAAIWINKLLDKFIPPLIEFVATPVILLLSILFLSVFLFIPISGYIFFGVSWLFQHLNTGPIAPFGNAILVAIFLIAVVFGVHQGFIPVYISLYQTTGINSLFPVLGLAGACQVGVAIAMFFIAKKGGKLRKAISAAIVPGFLGIGEPLIYGVSLPRIVPLICTCVAGLVPGFFMGALSAWANIDVGIHSVFGPSGLLTLIAITAKMGNGSYHMGIGIGCFAAGLVIAYITGFFTMQLGWKLFKNNPKIQWNLE